MPRNYIIYLHDIISALKEIFEFSSHLSSFKDFENNLMALRAIERNLEIIGEAIKNIPDNIRDCSPDIEWKKIAGLRDIIIHSYFSVNPKILWDLIHNHAPVLNEQINELIGKIESGHCI